MYTCIIVDDEQHAIEGLTKYLETMPGFNLVNTFTDPFVALRTITDGEAVDLIFMDIDMPKITGLELSRAVRNKTKKLIFTTAHTKYAYEAFEAEADAYLLKPYSLGKFTIALAKLFPEQIVTKNNEETSYPKEDFFFVKSKVDNLKIVKVNYNDIIAVESKLNYVMIHTHTKQIITYMSLIEITKILSEVPGFMQLHRSYIIKQDQIESIDGNAVKMINGIEITVGDNYRKDFNAFVNERLIKGGKK